MHNAITDLLNCLRNGTEAARRATARVEWEADPKMPGRRAYRITGQSRAVVQAAIDRLMSTVDPVLGGSVGRANFIGPARIESGWGALGEVIMQVAA